MENFIPVIEIDFSNVYVKVNDLDVKFIKSGHRWFFGIKNWFYEIHFLDTLGYVMEVESLQDARISGFKFRGVPNLTFSYKYSSNIQSTFLTISKMNYITENFLTFSLSSILKTFSAEDVLDSIYCDLSCDSGELTFNYYQKHIQTDYKRVKVTIQGLSGEELAKELVFGV